jgi:O-antigen ligase
LYLLNSSSIIESYLRAKTLPTPLNDDHVRFSWVVVIAVVLSLRQSLEAIRTVTKFIYALLAVFFILYLHLLSARTGLLMLYVFLLFFIVFIIRRYSPRKIIPAILLLIIVVATCWLTFPTLQNRLRYNRYDFSFIQKGHINPGTSDANRAISLQAGWDILKNNPFGVGAGDVNTAVDQWYRQNHPGIADASKLYPSSEWLVYGNFMGWPAVLAFTIIIIIPIFTSVFRSRFYWFCLNVIAICAFILETSLEIQFGIFIYCFTLLWWWKWFRADPISQKI